jgi:ABC-2 type transport system ATP-binding protein
VAIIHRGRLVAQGSIEELRAGVEARTAGVSPASLPPDVSSEKLTLEQIFLAIVGGKREATQELSWLV